MTVEIFKTILSVASTVCAIIFGYLAFSRNKKADDVEDGKRSGAVFTELGYIRSSVDRIERKQDKQGDELITVLSRLAAVEESDKNAHKRITALENRSNAKER